MIQVGDRDRPHAWPRWIAALVPSGRTSALMLVLAVTGGCAERVPEPVVVPKVPHVSWVIAVETTNGQERVVCQSDPRTECLLPSSTRDRRTLATVHLYLHPSTAETKYVGTMRVTFLDGSSAEVHETKVDSTVGVRDAPVGASLTGIVTERAGSYSMTIALTATSPAATNAHEIQDTVQVTVK